VTGLLVSVRSGVEARSAIAGGAQLIDIKEPRHGSLGAASAAQWHEVIQAAGGQVPLSVALGELIDPALPARLASVPAVAFAKIGLAGCRDRPDWIPRWRRAIERLPSGTAAVAVTYADAIAAQTPDPDAIRHHACELGCRAMLWDTFLKTSGGLLARLPLERLSVQVAAAREQGMLIVLAGSLTWRDLPALEHLNPDWIAVRGAVCATSRTGHVEQQLVECMASALAHAGQRIAR